MISESNPARYREMSVPFKDADTAAASVDAFLEDVKAARIKHKITDVSLVLRVSYCESDGAEVEAAHQCHYGNTMLAPLMLAAALGGVRESLANEIDRAQTGRRKAGKSPC